MRGDDEQQMGVFSYVSPEQRVPQNHPLRPLRAMADEALRELGPRFNKLYAKAGRPSIAPEKLLRALLLQVLYSVRSERAHRLSRQPLPNWVPVPPTSCTWQLHSNWVWTASVPSTSIKGSLRNSFASS